MIFSRNAASSGKSVTVKSSGGSLSRQRYPCLACGEVKRWDQLTQHYKVVSRSGFKISVDDHQIIIEEVRPV